MHARSKKKSHVLFLFCKSNHSFLSCNRIKQGTSFLSTNINRSFYGQRRILSDSSPCLLDSIKSPLWRSHVMMKKVRLERGRVSRGNPGKATRTCNRFISSVRNDITRWDWNSMDSCLLWDIFSLWRWWRRKLNMVSRWRVFVFSGRV